MRVEVFRRGRRALFLIHIGEIRLEENSRFTGNVKALFGNYFCRVEDETVTVGGTCSLGMRWRGIGIVGWDGDRRG